MKDDEDNPGQIIQFVPQKPKGKSPPPDNRPSFDLHFGPDATAELDRLRARTGAPSRMALIQRAVQILCAAFPEGARDQQIRLADFEGESEVLFTRWD